MSKTLFARYRWGLQNLMETLGSDHPRITAVRILQQHLVENLNNPAAREDIIKRLNQLCIELTGKAFERFCELEQSSVQQKPKTPPAPETPPKEQLPTSFDEYVAWFQPLLDTDRLKLPAVRQFVQARTLTIMQNLNPTHKGQVVQFLYDAAMLFAAPHSLSLAQADLTNVVLVEADLGGINLAETNLAGANLVGATLTQSTLSRANLTGVNLGWAILPGTDFTQAELAGAILTGADLRAANLHGAHLVKTNAKQADITQSDMTNVNLLGANLERAILTQTDFTGSQLLWTNLRNARLDGAQFEDATYNQHTQWPDGFDPTTKGAIKID